MFMVSSTDFTMSLLGRMRFSTANRISRGASTAGRGEEDGLVSGRSHDRQRAPFMSATGQFRDRVRAVSRVRCHLGLNAQGEPPDSSGVVIRLLDFALTPT